MKKALLFMAAIFLICSCSSDKDDEELDGKWPPMEWQADFTATVVKGFYIVNPEGETLQFSCKNYENPWIAEAMYGDGTIIPFNNNSMYTLRGKWFTASISGNKLTIVFDKNTELTSRKFSLTVTAGDIFYTFYFSQMQLPSSKTEPQVG